MKIKIIKNADQRYVQDNTDYLGIYFGDPEWEELLSKISDKIIPVDTEELFKYEFNTLPIPNISKEGIRVPDEYVSEIFDDARIGKSKCELCEKVSNSMECCEHCGRADYLEALIDEDWEEDDEESFF